MALLESKKDFVIKDASIKRQVEEALKDRTFSDAEIDKVIVAALDGAGKKRITYQEAVDLLTLVRKSKTISAKAKEKILLTLLKRYEPYRKNADPGIAPALRHAMTDNSVSREELKQIVKDAVKMRVTRGPLGAPVNLTRREISDLLRLSKYLGTWERRFVKAAVVCEMKGKLQPPTSPREIPRKLRDGRGEFKFVIRLLEDDPVGAKTITDFKYTPPVLKTDSNANITTWPRVDVVEIQTHYLPGESYTDKSAYGRGTTYKDIWDGNITVGFHEKCHQDHFIKTLKNDKIPTFMGTDGMSLSQLRAEFNRYLAALGGFFRGMREETVRRVDEKGHRLSVRNTPGIGSFRDIYDREKI